MILVHETHQHQYRLSVDEGFGNAPNLYVVEHLGANGQVQQTRRLTAVEHAQFLRSCEQTGWKDLVLG